LYLVVFVFVVDSALFAILKLFQLKAAIYFLPRDRVA